MACVRLSCGTCGYAIVAGRRRPVGGGHGRYAAGLDPVMGSIVRNPALPNRVPPTAVPAEARGVYAVTRHPMMWAFTLWGICHIAVYPVAANIIVASAIIILALSERRCRIARRRRSSPTLGLIGKGRPAIGRLARLSPVGRGSAVSACTRSPVVSFYGSPQPGRTFLSPTGRRAFGAGCSGDYPAHAYVGACARKSVASTIAIGPKVSPGPFR